jgi:hypothetical protein
LLDPLESSTTFIYFAIVTIVVVIIIIISHGLERENLESSITTLCFFSVLPPFSYFCDFVSEGFLPMSKAIIRKDKEVFTSYLPL